MPVDASSGAAVAGSLRNRSSDAGTTPAARDPPFHLKDSRQTPRAPSTTTRADPGVGAHQQLNWKMFFRRGWFVVAAGAALGIAVAADLFLFRSNKISWIPWHSHQKESSSVFSKLRPNSIATQIPEIMGAEAFADFPERELIFTGTLDGLLHRITVGYADHTAIKLDSRPLLRLNNSDVGDGSICGTPENEASCGRILGLKVIVSGANGTPSIVACDSVRGLILIEDVANDNRKFMEFPVSVLTNTVDDSVERPHIRFCNAVEVSGDSVFFTDSSKYSRTQFLKDVLDGSPSGRLLRYDFSTGKTQTIIDRLHFANGLSLNHEEDSLLVAELRNSRILRLPLRLLDDHSGIELPIDATKADELLHWNEDLPIYPDNIQQFADGASYLIGGPFRTPTGAAKFLMSIRLVRQALSLLPDRLAWRAIHLLSGGGSSAFTVLLKSDGSVDTALDLSQIGPSSQLSDCFETKWSRVVLLGSFGPNPLVVAPGIASLLLN